MKADYVSYRKAAACSVIGAVIHAVLAVGLLIYGLKAADHTAVSASLYVGLGILVWISLAVVHDQHRRERIEALEHDALTQDKGGSVFEGQGDFRVAAKRLDFIEKWALPSVSLVFGSLLIAAGWWRFSSARPRLDASTFVPSASSGWGVGLWFLAALTGFLFARYVAGMAKQPAWSKLRAGAGLSVAMALMGLASVIAHLIDTWGPDGMVRWLQVVFPLVMIVLGVEVFINFLLDLYRPRKAGETRPLAADSRLMSFLAAPDRIAESASEAINYQFGYNVTSTWLYQLLSRSLANLLILGLLVGWLLSAAAVVQPHQRALVLRFGHVAREIGPGLHFKLPWPIERLSIPSYSERDAKGKIVDKGMTTTGVRTLQLGKPLPAKERTEPILWTNEHGAGEVFFVVRPSPLQIADLNPDDRVADKAADSAWLSDLALIAAEIPMQYAVRDVQAFESLGDPDQRESILKTTAQRAVMRTLRGYSVDQILGPKRTELAPRLRTAIEDAFAKLNPDPSGKPRGSGVEILSVSVQGVHPSKAVAPSFEKVVQAEQGAEGLVEAANAAALGTLIAMTGSRQLATDLVAAIEEKDRLSSSPNDSPDALRAVESKIADLLADCRGKVAQSLAQASAARWEKHLGMRERALRYAGQVASFEANEPLFRAHLYFDALVNAVRETRLVITDDDRNLRINADLIDKSTDSGFSILDSEVATK
jgi:regulator of protease activity HflC (stomatin/prohibitin superfamily)